MQAERRVRNIALIGFMGTGKSTVGRLVAAQLRFDFVDTDHLIEARSGATISQIFEQSGEAAFREYEHKVIVELESARNTVISAGGGVVVNPANLESLRSHALVVCLWAKAEAIYERVRTQNHRPLLQTPDALGRIQQLLAAREPAYRKADVIIGTELRSIREVAGHVVHQFREASAPVHVDEERHSPKGQ